MLNNLYMYSCINFMQEYMYKKITLDLHKKDETLL